MDQMEESGIYNKPCSYYGQGFNHFLIDYYSSSSLAKD